jgi:hypothetical protein
MLNFIDNNTENNETESWLFIPKEVDILINSSLESISKIIKNFNYISNIREKIIYYCNIFINNKFLFSNKNTLTYYNNNIKKLTQLSKLNKENNCVYRSDVEIFIEYN